MSGLTVSFKEQPRKFWILVGDRRIGEGIVYWNGRVSVRCNGDCDRTDAHYISSVATIKAAVNILLNHLEYGYTRDVKVERCSGGRIR